VIGRLRASGRGESTVGQLEVRPRIATRSILAS
jgi:hypothetical protein